jgi:hypothetical protein
MHLKDERVPQHPTAPAFSTAGKRRAAGARLLALIDEVRVRSGGRELSEEAVSHLIDREVAVHRRRKRERCRSQL